MNKYDAANVFQVVVERGSLVAAAKYLNQSPSAISKQISFLEQQLGVQLLKRTTRKIQQTESGRLFYRNFRQIDSRWESLLEEVQAVSALPQGTLRIAAPQPLCSRLLAEIAGEFQVKYPEIDIELQVEHYDHLPRDEADVSICREIASFNSAHHVGKKVCDYSNRMYASPEYLAEKGSPRTLSELSQHRCLYFGLTTSTSMWKFANDKTVVVSGNLRTNNTEVMIAWSVAGYGIALLPPLLIQSELKRGELVPVLPRSKGQTVGCWAYYQKLDYPSRKVSIFIDYLKSHLYSSSL